MEAARSMILGRYYTARGEFRRRNTHPPSNVNDAAAANLLVTASSYLLSALPLTLLIPTNIRRQQSLFFTRSLPLLSDPRILASFHDISYPQARPKISLPQSFGTSPPWLRVLSIGMLFINYAFSSLFLSVFECPTPTMFAINSKSFDLADFVDSERALGIS